MPQLPPLSHTYRLLPRCTFSYIFFLSMVFRVMEHEAAVEARRDMHESIIQLRAVGVREFHTRYYIEFIHNRTTCKLECSLEID